MQTVPSTTKWVLLRRINSSVFTDRWLFALKWVGFCLSKIFSLIGNGMRLISTFITFIFQCYFSGGKREVKNSLLRIDFREWPTTQFSSRKKTFTIDVNNVFLNLTFADRHFDLFNVELIFALSRRKNSLDFVLAFCLTFVFTFANLLKYFFRESNFRENGKSRNFLFVT